MSDKMVTVAAFNTIEEAHLVKNVLEAEGIKALLADESSVGLFWFLGNALGGVKVMVAENQAERALEVLDEYDQQEEVEEDSSQITEKPSFRKTSDPNAETQITERPSSEDLDEDEDDEEEDDDEDGQAKEKEQGEPPRSVPGEVMATRALFSAVFGLFCFTLISFSLLALGFFIFTGYSVWLLLQFVGWDGELSVSAKRKIFWSAMVNGVTLLTVIGKFGFRFFG